MGFGETHFACSKPLCSQWLQPSGFTQNVQRTQVIVSGQDVMLQSLGVITSHSPHENAVDRPGPAGRKEPAQHQQAVNARWRTAQ